MKLILFDLDGVLVDAKDIHYRCLNKALYGSYHITPTEHRTTYDGLPTKDKLRLLTEQKGLPKSAHKAIEKAKQEYTQIELKNISPNPELITLFECLRSDGYSIGVCTNSIRETMTTRS